MSLIFPLFLKTEHSQIALALTSLDSSLTTFLSEVCHVNADRQILGQAAQTVEQIVSYILGKRCISV